MHIRTPQGPLCHKARVFNGALRQREQTEGTAGIVRCRREDTRPPHAADGPVAAGWPSVVQVLPVHARVGREEEEAEE